MPPQPLHVRIRQRAITFALLALLLVGAQSLGLVHRVSHAGGTAIGTQQADWFGHAPADGVFCPLYDQLAAADPLPPAPPAMSASLPAPSRPAVAAGTGVPAVATYRPFLARAPPLVSAV